MVQGHSQSGSQACPIPTPRYSLSCAEAILHSHCPVLRGSFLIWLGMDTSPPCQGRSGHLPWRWAWEALRWGMFFCSARALHKARLFWLTHISEELGGSLIQVCPLLSIISQGVYEAVLPPNSNLGKSEMFGSFKRQFGQQKWEEISRISLYLFRMFLLQLSHPSWLQAWINLAFILFKLWPTKCAKKIKQRSVGCHPAGGCIQCKTDFSRAIW